MFRHGFVSSTKLGYSTHSKYCIILHSIKPVRNFQSSFSSFSSFPPSCFTSLASISSIHKRPLSSILHSKSISSFKSNEPTFLHSPTAFSFSSSTPAVSSYSTSTTATTTSTFSPSSNAGKSELYMNWNEYFTERKKRQVRNRIFNVFGIPTAFIGGVIVFAKNIILDPTDLIFGIEAPLIYTLAAFGIGTMSAILAPMSLESVWRLTHPTKCQLIDQKDKEFYQRIRKYRADPSLSLIGNQVYDFYGEKITSLNAYRVWLRKQRRLKEKATIKLGAGDEKPIEIQ